MEYNNKKFYRGVILFIVIMILNVELPYSDKSILQYIFPKIRIGPGYINLSAIVWIIVMIISYREILNSKRYKAKPITIFFIMYFIIIPLTINNIDIIKTPIYYLRSGVKSLEVVDSRFCFYKDSNINYLELDTIIKSYRNLDERFDIYVELPDTIKNYFKEDTILIEKNVKMGLHQERDKTKRVEVDLKEGYTIRDLGLDLDYNFKDYKLILNGNNSRSEIVMNDLY